MPGRRPSTAAKAATAARQSARSAQVPQLGRLRQVRQVGRVRQVRQPLPPANEGSFDSHAFSAAATLELLGFKPFRNLSAGEEPAAGGDVGRVVGIGSPCDDMQLRNDANAVAKPPKPPNPPPDGRSDAQALLAFSNVLLLPDEPPNPPPKPPPPKPPEGGRDGRVVGTLTPC
jgi:hypothetical protein